MVGEPIANPATTSVYFNDKKVVAYNAGEGSHRIEYRVDGSDPIVVKNAYSLAAPSLCELGNRLYLFFTGVDGGLYWNTMSLKMSFDQVWRKVPGLPKETGPNRLKPFGKPAILSSHGMLIVASVSESNRLYWNGMNSSGVYQGWTQIPGNGATDGEISLTALEDNWIMAAHKGFDRRIYFNEAEFALGQFFWDSRWRPEPSGALMDGMPLLTSDQRGMVCVAVRSGGQSSLLEVLSWKEESPFNFQVVRLWGRRS